MSPTVTAIETSPKINIDLQRERQLATICSEDFAEWWAGGRAALEQRRALEKLFFDDIEFGDTQHISYLSHKEHYEHITRRATKFLKKLREWYATQQAQEQAKGIKKTPSEKNYEFRLLISSQLGTALFQQSFPLRLHFSMFMPALLRLGTEEQKQQWLDKAWNMQGIIGTYAQTELGHGTYLRGLETRADFDVEKQEFVLNTPTITAYKFWPGGLGHTANMVVIMAQLYIKGKNYGVQPFLVRIRNEETHLPEPGVDVGEIGSKLGINGVNNGFLGLKNVRIPRTQMLMKNAQVLPNGKFVKGPEPLLNYGTMVFVRVMIVRDAAFTLMQAATIATRYSAVRRQSPIELNQPEPQIIDHLTQQVKLFPQIAKVIFYHRAADVLWRMYEHVMQELDSGNRRNLPELHSLSCCLKALCSHECAHGIEVLRKACGGHGYLSSANFQSIYGAATATCTYEGENTVMLLQTARYLIKQYVEGLKRKVLPKSVAYLRLGGAPKWSKELSTLVRLLELAAAERVRSTFEYMRALRKKGNSEQAAANLAGNKLTQAATLHGRAFLARMAVEEFAQMQAQLKPILCEVLGQLLGLFVIDMFMVSLGDVMCAYALNFRQVAELELHYEQLLGAFRRNAVAVVDGFDLHDRVLCSTLGCYDGRAYERLMEEVRSSTLNQKPVNDTFHTHLKPFMQGKL